MGKFVVNEVKTGIKFNLKAGNGEIIATSEVYSSEAACMNENIARCCPMNLVRAAALHTLKT